MIGSLKGKKEELERKIRAREFVFGIQDGLISTVGLLSGIVASGQSRAVVVITGIAAGLTGGLSMATGSYLSAKTEKDLFEKELLDQEKLATDEPYLAQEALLESLTEEGLDRPSAYRVVGIFTRRQKLLLETVQEKVLGLGTADLSQPIKAATVMYISFLIGAAIPIIPYTTPLKSAALPLSWALSVSALFTVGIFKGALTRKSLLKSGLEFAGVALASAFAGWVIGRLIDGIMIWQGWK